MQCIQTITVNMHDPGTATAAQRVCNCFRNLRQLQFEMVQAAVSATRGCRNLDPHNTLTTPSTLHHTPPQQDVMFQYTRKSSAGTIKARQLVPGMHWEVVPSPVVEVSWCCVLQSQALCAYLSAACVFDSSHSSASPQCLKTALYIH